MGIGDLGQLGHNNKRSYGAPKYIEKLSQYLQTIDVSSPQRTQAVNNKVIVRDICCGANHSMLLTSNGKVYSWGNILIFHFLDHLP